MKEKISFKLIALIFGSLAIFFLTAFYLYAWTEPSTSPPGNNAAVPLNISGTAQIKSGALQVNGFRNYLGNTILDGSLDIANANLYLGADMRFYQSGVWMYLYNDAGSYGGKGWAADRFWANDDIYVQSLGGWVSTKVCRSDGTNCPAGSTDALTLGGVPSEQFVRGMSYSGGAGVYDTRTLGRDLYNPDTAFAIGKAGFLDVWGGGGTYPPGTSHIQGFQAMHYLYGYGIQIAGQYNQDAVYVRQATAGTLRPWRLLIDSGNIGSQSVSYATSAGRAQRANGNFYIDDNYGNSVVGVYASTRYQGVFAMGDAYKLSADGTTPGNLYGIAWTHENVGGQSKPGLGHQALFMMNGITYTAIGNGIWTNGNLTVSGTAYANGYALCQSNGTNCPAAGSVSWNSIIGRPNINPLTGSYGGVDINGTTNSYSGIYFPDQGQYLMVDGDGATGFYRPGYWMFYTNTSGDWYSSGYGWLSDRFNAKSNTGHNHSGESLSAANYYMPNTAYGFIGNNVYADTINTGVSGDPLEINYYRQGDVRICNGPAGLCNVSINGNLTVTYNNAYPIQLGALWGHTGLLNGSASHVMYFGSDQYFQFLNRSGGYGPGVYAQDYYSNAAGVWMSQLCRSNGTNCPAASSLPGNLTYWDTWYGSAYLGSNGDMYMNWDGRWLSQTINQDVRSGASPTFSTVYATANGAAYLCGGDDACLYDINWANTVGIYGTNDSRTGTIKLGSQGGTISGFASGVNQPPGNSYGSGVRISPDLFVEGKISIGSASNIGYQLELSQDSAAKPNGGTWSDNSDERIKKNVVTMSGALEKIKQLRGVNFEWINPEEHGNLTGVQGGFLAQDVEKVFPGWVSEVNPRQADSLLVGPDGKVKTLSLPFEFSALTVEAIKEQQKEIDGLNVKIDNLMQRIEELEKEVKK